MALDKNQNVETKKSNILIFFKKHLILTGLLIVIGSGFSFAMSDRPEIYSWKYKTTIIVDTPEGEKSGSAVREMSFVVVPCAKRAVEPCSIKASTKGEAVVIDLGRRGVAFATMTDSSYYAVRDLFGGPGTLTFEGVKYYSTLKNTKASLSQPPFPTYPSTQYPLMVTFKDMKDPKSIELVYRSERIRIPNQMEDDYKITDNFEKLFGKGVKIKDVTIEMTDEDITWGIDSYLAWLSDLANKQARLNGSTSIAISTNDLSDNLGPGSFKIGR
ncbi:MAG: hypothetical protein JNN09_03190 [Alphaproteobacteria bacterium]|nr:hypothetical protein [Alphaproteobacteria bacterium]